MDTVDARQTTYPPLVVPSDPAASLRTTRGAYVLMIGASIAFALLGMVAAAGFAAATSALSSGAGVGFLVGAGVSLAIFGVAFVSMFVNALRFATMRGEQSLARTVLVLDDAGLHSTIAQGRLDLPWGAIERISVRPRGKHRVITFHMQRGLTMTSPGIQTDFAPKTFGVIVKRGFAIGSAAVSVPVDEIAAAALAFTGGRLSTAS